jgi:SAM-dependent methyltransferase
MGRAYDASAAAWASGPEAVYARLAEVLVAASPVPAGGARVLDLGAGTGVAGRAAVAAGAADVVAVDIAAGMLRRGAGPSRPVVADAAALPFRADAFALVVAACCLGHLPDPVAALRETRRVGAAVVASAFEAGWTHPAKAAVEDTLGRFGYRPPAWYLAFKQDTEPRAGDPARLAALAAAAGYRDVRAETVAVVTGVDDPAGLADWRLGMAHLAPFVTALGPGERAEARHAVEAALVGAPELVVPLVVLAAS